MSKPDRAGMDVNHERPVPGERPGRARNEPLKASLWAVLYPADLANNKGEIAGRARPVWGTADAKTEVAWRPS